MSGLDAARRALAGAQAELTETRFALDAAAEAIDAARLIGDDAAAARATRRRTELVRRHAEAVETLRGRAAEVIAGIGAVLPPIGVGGGDPELEGVSEDVPIALLPVRLETRILGGRLKVRIYPDDVHIDDHEPLLDKTELEAGRTYWSSIAEGGAAAEGAWNALGSTVGAYRAKWVRAETEPGADGAAADPVLRIAGSRPARAMALPDFFFVRVRTDRGEQVVRTGPIADTLQVGVDMAGEVEQPAAPEGEPAPATPTGLLDLDGRMPEELAWLTDFDAAVAAGMAVDVDLSGATRVRDVTVVGTTITTDAKADADTLAELIRIHTVTGGAALVPPGTPTNNLSDVPSGLVFAPDPAQTAPAAVDVDPTTDAAILARALGLDPAALSALPGADGRHITAQEAMQRALFPTTWGPYLRELAAPAVAPGHVPIVRAHAVGFVRPGGPLPVLRLGHQPYGILPVQPPDAEPQPGDDAVVRWLRGFLRRSRRLWSSGAGDVPEGVDVLGHGAYSDRVQLRTGIAMYSQDPAIFGLDDDDLERGAMREKDIVAELGLGEARPMVLRQLWGKRTSLRLPMSAEGDTTFTPRTPDPKQATSVLGLLLRNAARQLLDDAADDLIDPHVIGGGPELTVEFENASPRRTVLPGLDGIAVSTNSLISTTPSTPFSAKLETSIDVAGASLTVGEALDLVIESPFDAAAAAVLENFAVPRVLRDLLSAIDEIAPLTVEERARLTGQALDAASHRYDAWVTSLATRRLHELRTDAPTGVQLGAWGYVSGFTARNLQPVAGREDVFEDLDNRGWLLAPTPRHATTAGVLRAAWADHGGRADGPFSVDLRSARVRDALALAEGMRGGQQLGALLGYLVERALHEAHRTHGIEADWVVYPLRRAFPLRVTSAEFPDASVADERFVVDGWALVQREAASPGAARAAVDADTAARGEPPVDWAELLPVLTAVLESAAGSLDALADLGVAESMYQLSGANFERAAAAADVIGRAATPPDRYDVPATPRGGIGIEQRMLVLFGADASPAGYASDTPRALVAPRAEAFVAARLGPLGGIAVWLVDAAGFALGSVEVAALGLSALDLAADAARQDSPVPFPLLTARAVAAGPAGATGIRRDPEQDAALLSLLRRSAAWHRALVPGRPLTASSFLARGAQEKAPVPVLAASVEALAAMVGAGPDRWAAYLGIFGDDAPGRITARIAAARETADPADALRALFDEPVIVEGIVEAVDPVWVDAAADQSSLGLAPGALAGWLQDSGRVRAPLAELDEAMLLDDLAGRGSLTLAAAQVPVQPYENSAARSWVNGVHPAPLGRMPVTTVVTAGSAPLAAASTGIELDTWTEVVPDDTSVGAVAANLPAPDARAPNTILLAVPGTGAWTQSRLFGVVDETIALADARLVDLDAVKRVPALLPAVYISEFDEDEGHWGTVVGGLDHDRVAWTTDATRWRP
ncbi:hypothetical protein [Microbacterium sp. NPDC058389]|uniref:hypothetical protein n=1 Tax=Microbacterium sp. NPDC058389 TaxID=3346475 RepID=UPI003650B52B